MFGFKNKKEKQLDKLEALLELGHAVDVMKAEAPGATYIFCRTVYDAHALQKDLSRSEMLSALRYAVTTQGEAASRLDGGMQVLAQRYIISCIQSMSSDVNSSMNEMYLNKIARYGEKYRDLSDKDKAEPEDDVLKNIISKAGVASVYEYLKLVHEEGNPSKFTGQNLDDISSTTLAMFDIRTEASSGRLLPHIRKLNDIIVRL